MQAGDIACWLLKTSVAPQQVSPGWSPGQVRTLRRCVRRSYRLALMTPGQPCVLWLSGPRDPGVHAIGRLVSSAQDGDEASDGPAVTVALRLLARPIARADLMQVPVFAASEVVRMPAGSNPSYLTPAQLGAFVVGAGADLPSDWPATTS